MLKLMDDVVTPIPRVLLGLGAITHLTLNRPALANALDWQMGEELEAAVSHIAQSPGVRVVIVSGAGRNFCAGGDLAFIEQNTRLGREQVEQRMLRFYEMFLSLLKLEVPTIALVQGNAIGAGLCLALACDLRLGSTTAKLAANFVRVGLHPGMGATVLLPSAVGPARANELLLTGAALDGQTAARWGLLTHAVEPDALEAEGGRMASALMQGAPIAVRQTLETSRGPLRASLGTALAREAACQAHDFGTQDVRLAVEAFKHRTTPQFVGR
jgi:enoyl-CoA hydratase/carnithine racemase